MRLDDEVRAGVVQRRQDLGAIRAGVDSRDHHTAAWRVRDSAFYVRLDEFRVVATEPHITRPQASTDAGSRLGDGGQDGVVAVASPVAWVVARQRSFLLPEHWLHRGVDVHVDVRRLGRQLGKRRQAVRRHDQLELCVLHLVETRKIAVHRVDARNHTTGKLDEQRIGRERLKPEDTLLAHQ